MSAAGLAGCTLGRYLLEREIGRGATSVVYCAQDVRGRRTVALKAASSPPGHDPVPVDLMREGRRLSCCRAPHVVQVFEVGQQDGVEFIAMELMASTLEKRNAEGPISGAEMIGIGAGMLLGLDAAHREGIVHGDIKPANVGISRHGAVKLLDFGAARALPGFSLDRVITTSMPAGGIVGTLPYMAPEQLRGDEVDERADLYAVGALLFELATGRPPFCEHGIVAMIDAVLHAEPPRPSTLNAGIDADTDDLLMTALAKAASRRFQSAPEMLDALLETSTAQRALAWRGLMRPGWTQTVASARDRGLCRVRSDFRSFASSLAHTAL